MYNSNDIQEMLTKAKTNKDRFFKEIDNSGISALDKESIKSVINDGWYESFDRYDSAVCEYFIDIFEKVRI